jgi:hypothetical protein
MANFCCNTVHFIGNATNKEKLQELFAAMAAKEDETHEGQLPPFVAATEGYQFQTAWEDGVLFYQTKWSPNFEVIKQIADHFSMGFHMYYDELGNGIYGEALYENSKLVNLFLEDSDFEQYEYQEETEDYLFEGKLYESDYDILEILMERKKAALEYGFMVTW